MSSTQKELLEKFYTAFSKGDATTMNSCYHSEATFEDPAFGELDATKAKAMWEMLLGKKEESKFEVSFDVLDDNNAKWKATYLYGPQKKKVINLVNSNFEFKDGLILRHKDDFDLWKWTQQALGISGYLLGWSGFMKNKIQDTTGKTLKQYMS